MKKEIKNTRILEKTVRLENGKILKHVQDDKFGFTLAEVLITLGIIGVVAAMTIPSLIQKYQEKVFVTGAKKFYSLISQAAQLAVINNGLPETWDLSNHENMIKFVAPYLKITDYCTGKNGKVCYHNNDLYFRNGNTNGSNYLSGRSPDRPAFRLNDGTVVGTCNATRANLDTPDDGLIEYLADINGDKKPNTLGKDIFIFILSKKGTIRPYGSMQDGDTSQYSFKQGCLNSNAKGFGCTAWVVQNGNMDYWHCNDLSWDGKHKCSD